MRVTSQLCFCNLPVSFDTYKGCSHRCAYCFVKRKSDISDIDRRSNLNSLEKFIKHPEERAPHYKYLPKNIPIHWGGLSDPFQPIEKKYRLSKQALEIFAETGYPVVISTKGKLLVDPEYVALIDKCNAVIQISMVCDKYDKIEPGCPSFRERLDMCRIIAPHCKRLITRIQPYMVEVLDDVLATLPELKQAGVYGVVVEGMKFVRKPNTIRNLVKIGGDYCYDKDLLLSHFVKIKNACHDVGLVFLCGENRLRTLGDSMTCCGCEGLDGFEPNTFNCSYIYNNVDCCPLASQTEKITPDESRHLFSGLYQSANSSAFAGNSIEEIFLSRDIFDISANTLLNLNMSRIYKNEEKLLFTSWLRSTGITRKEVRELTGTQMDSHYLTLKSQPEIPTLEEWEKMKGHPKLQNPPRYILKLLEDQIKTKENFTEKHKKIVENYKKKRSYTLK